MNCRNLVLSIIVGGALTVALLFGFGLSHDAVMASEQSGDVVEPVTSEGAIAPRDAISTAYVVVRFSDAESIVRPVTFTEPITAYTALQRTGLELDILDMGWGLLVCGIDGVGESLPDESDCDNGTRFWGTSYWSGDAWVGRMVGIAGAWITETGHVEGFSFSNPGWAAVDPPAAPPLTAASDALEWLRGQQKTDGSFGTMNDTAEVLMAVGANRWDASDWRTSPSLLANVISEGPEFANRNAAGAGKLAAALTRQEACWPIGAKTPLDHYHPISSTFSRDTLYQAWGVLGAATLSETIPTPGVEALKDNQQPDGGWELFVGFGSDTNSTALAIQALLAAGEPLTSTGVVSGLAYLDNAQNEDGGFPYSPDSPWGTDSDANSTAYVVQSLIAAGEDPLGARWTAAEGDPISYLLDMQLPDGSFEWQEGYGSNQMATRQSVLALLGRPFPLSVGTMPDCYGIAGHVTSDVGEGGKSPLTGVAMEAEGAEDVFVDTTDATGAYTISVPAKGTFELTPHWEGFTFSPPFRAVEVSGTPGDVLSDVDFSGVLRSYLPVVMRG